LFIPVFFAERAKTQNPAPRGRQGKGRGSNEQCQTHTRKRAGGCKGANFIIKHPRVTFMFCFRSQNEKLKASPLSHLSRNIALKGLIHKWQGKGDIYERI